MKSNVIVAAVVFLFASGCQLFATCEPTFQQHDACRSLLRDWIAYATGSPGSGGGRCDNSEVLCRTPDSDTVASLLSLREDGGPPEVERADGGWHDAGPDDAGASDGGAR